MTRAQLEWLFIVGIVAAMGCYIAVNLWGWL